MSQESKNPKDEFVSILKNIIYMCDQSIKKSHMLISKAKDDKLISIEDIETGIELLIERMFQNVGAFKDDFKKAVNEYKCLPKPEDSSLVVSPKKKSILSLRKNGTTQETDVESVNSDAEGRASNEKSEQKEDAIDVPKNSVKDEMSESSDDDSQATIPLGHFDVQVLNESKEDGGQVVKDELGKTPTNSIFEGIQDQMKDDIEFESMSFDFDDVAGDLNTKLEKREKDNQESTADSIKQAHKNNHELLELLNKATDDNPKYPECTTTEQEGDEALMRLEDEMSSSSHTDSDDSMLWSVDEDSEDDEPHESHDTVEADNEIVSDLENTTQVDQCKELSVKLDRLDEISDAEIDRLCNTNNINKRKCSPLLRSKRRLKRTRMLSTSSSSSISSMSTSSGSTTPDLNIAEIEPRPPSRGHDIEKLADALLPNLMDSESNKSSSESDTDVEKEHKTKEKNPREKKEASVVVEDEVKEEAEDKRKSDWRNHPLLRERLWSSSDSDAKSDSDKKPKIVRKRLSGNEVAEADTTVISDSLSDNSDNEVTFVEEYNNDDNGGVKGRRNIRPILTDEELTEATQRAKYEEDERIQRLEEHSKTIESILSQHDEFVLDFDLKSGKPVITVDQNLADKLKPHQRAGVQFMWRACYEGVNMLKTNAGTGCILAHCMGLGKTLQVITLIHTLFTHDITGTKHVLIACPLSTVSNWKNEFRLAFNEVAEVPKIELFFLIKEDIYEKSRIVTEWRRGTGVLVMGYEAFQSLTNKKLTGKFTEEARNKLSEALVDPGPDLIVCDEGHLLKNGETRRTKALMLVKTKRRIVLTGTPLQNNLMEYYFMVQFVKPHLLGTFDEYKNRFAYPIQNGHYFNSTPQDIQLMKKRTHVLTHLLKRTIDRVETSVLAEYLPEIYDYTIFIKLTPIQTEIYKRYIEMVTKHTLKSTGFFQDFRVTKLINLHPHVLDKHCTDVKNRKKKVEKEIINPAFEKEEQVNINVKGGWYEDLKPVDVSTNINYSSKLKVMLAIINETIRNGEKALIFAHHLVELDCLEHFLLTHGTSEWPRWVANVDYYRMDGTVPPDRRSKLCNDFNTNKAVKIFLISHKVGGLGLNLTAANRVILIGSNHNPSYDTQSIYRAYRFGQTKKCFVYRLLSIGTMEEKIYRRCVLKLSVAATVVDKLHLDRHYKSNDLQEMYAYNFDVYEERPIPAVPSDLLLAKLLQNTTDIFSYHEHNALLENRPEEELNDEDKKLAWEEFNNLNEAAKNVVAAAQPPPAPPPLNRPTIFPANLTFPFNRFGQYCGTRNAQSIVLNPMNLNGRAPFGRLPPSYLANQPKSGNLPFNNTTRPSTSGQNNFNQIRPHFNLSRNNNNTNPFALLLRPSNDIPRSSRERPNVSAPEVVEQSITTNPMVQRQNVFHQNVPIVNLVDEAPSRREFNYALNKII